jgi:spermidine/putrescine transport system ATP-binding protein
MTTAGVKAKLYRIDQPVSVAAGASAEPALRLHAVTKSLAGQAVVREVSLDIRRGEFFSLLGPSGCGKTTLLRLIAGFERPDRGEIRFDGADPHGPPAYARDLNLVFQHYALFPHLTVAGNVAFGLEMQRVPRAEREERVAEALRLVRLTGFEDRYPRALSGGQQQRVALARALVTRPSVLLLDEPLGALDLKLRRAMQEELKGLQRRLGITFIYVTHDQEEALAMSDRVAVMNRGRVLQVGTPAEVYDRPVTRFVAGFIGESNFLDGTVTGVSAPQVEVAVPGQTIRAHGSAQPGAEVTVALRPERIALARRSPSHDNRFPAIIERAVYLGTDTRYHIRLDGGAQLLVRQQNNGGRLLGEGDRVHASWPVEAGSLVMPDPTD